MQTTFDATFDYTFQGIVIDTNPPTEAGCRQPGFYLGWLTLCGWAYWLFTGKADEDILVGGPAVFRNVGLNRYAWKESSRPLTLRSGPLDRETHRVVSSIYESPSIYLLAHDSEDKITAVEVTVETGTYQGWREANARNPVEVRINPPSVRSQRVSLGNRIALQS